MADNEKSTQKKGLEIFNKYIRTCFDNGFYTENSYSSAIGEAFKKELEKYDIRINWNSATVSRGLFMYDARSYRIYKGEQEVFNIMVWDIEKLRYAVRCVVPEKSCVYNLVDGDWLIEIENAYLKINNCKRLADTFDEKGKSIVDAIRKLEHDCEISMSEEGKDNKNTAVSYIEKLKESGLTYKVDCRSSGFPYDLGFGPGSELYSTFTVDHNCYLFKDGELVFWGNTNKTDLGRNYKPNFYKDGKWVEEFDNIMNESPYYQVEKNDPAEMKLKPGNNQNN